MFHLVWESEAQETYNALMAKAAAIFSSRQKSGKAKPSREEGLFKQVNKCILLLRANPRHPGLQTHEFTAIPHPFDSRQKVFDAYAQHRTPGAYRVFWCYGPGKGDITIIAITPHP